MEAFQFGKVGNAKKENHPSKTKVRSGRRKALYRRERDSLEGPHQEAEHSVRLEMREELDLQRRYMFRKGKSAVEGDPKTDWSWIETEAGAE